MTDYIEKNSVIELIDDAIRNCKWHVAECTINTDDRDLKTLREKVKAIPAADVVEVVHAEWVHIIENHYKCSNCWGRANVPEFLNEPLYEYCPFCGARMDGGESNGQS